jgi:transposase
MPTPHAAPLVLSGTERQLLAGWAAAAPGTALAIRARIVLRCAQGGTIGEVAGELGVSRNTVSTWRARFQLRRLSGLTDRPRPGRPRTITDEQAELVITATLRESPARGTRWSTRSMAAATGLSQTAVSRLWRASGLTPHQAGPAAGRG